MTSNPNNEREVSRIFFVSECGESKSFPGTQGETAKLRIEYHGEYDTEWVCVYDDAGRETERWNAGKLLGIIWSNVPGEVKP